MDNYKFLAQTFLFKNLTTDFIKEILSDITIKEVSYKRGETIFSSSTTEKCLGFVLEGCLEVKKNSSELNSTVINKIDQFGSFGILSILSVEDFPTKIIAYKNSSVLYISSADFTRLVNNYSQIANNLIHFLANRIIFLNKKIETFSGTRVEDRLCAYLISESKKRNSSTFPINLSKTSEEINAGRASIYRVLSSLVDEGIINIDNKKITILDTTKLERKTK